MTGSSNQYPVLKKKNWIRSQNGWLAGICDAIARRFDLPVGIIRLIWVIAIFAYGASAILYLILAFCLPREDEAEADEPKILGVCHRLSQKGNIELGLIRTIAVVSGFLSLGLSVFIYLILYFVLPDETPSVSL